MLYEILFFGTSLIKSAILLNKYMKSDNVIVKNSNIEGKGVFALRDFNPARFFAFSKNRLQLSLGLRKL